MILLRGVHEVYIAYNTDMYPIDISKDWTQHDTLTTSIQNVSTIRSRILLGLMPNDGQEGQDEIVQVEFDERFRS